MFSSRALGQCTARTANSSINCLRRPYVLLPTARKLLPPASPPPCSHQTLAASSHPQERTASTLAAKRPLYKYPTVLNIYDSGLFPNLAIGTSRISTIVVLGLGLVYITPRVLFDPASPWWMAPLVAVGSAVPMIVTYLASGNYVQHIHVFLPESARRSKEDLMSFASNVPLASTQLYIKGIRFAPWPTTRSMFFEDLRRVRPGWTHMANLEHVPSANLEMEMRSKRKIWGWLVKRMMGTYYVSRSQVRDRSRAPGVLDQMWEQIPMEGESNSAGARRKKEQKGAVERQRVLMANRPARVTSSSSAAGRSRAPVSEGANKR